MAILRRAQARTQPQGSLRRRLPRTSVLPTRTLIIAGAVITILTVLFVGSKALRNSRPSGQVVLVAVTAIPARAPIVPQVVRPQMIPSERVPKDAVRSPEQVMGKVTKQPILAGEVLTESVLMSIEEAMGIASALSDGMQAFTIVLPVVDAVMGRIVPGNRVDVLGTFQQPAPATRVLARDVRIVDVQEVEFPLPHGSQGEALAGGTSQQGQTAKALAITLAVPREAVPSLVLGQHSGRLALAVYPAKGESLPGGVDGVSIPVLVQELLPKDGAGGSSPRPNSMTPSATPPPPPPQIQLPPPPTPARPSSPVTPAPRGDAADKEPVPGKQPGKEKLPVVQHAVEVIRGGQVKVEVVPIGDAAPTEESARSRSRQESVPLASSASAPPSGAVPGYPPELLPVPTPEQQRSGSQQ